MFDVAYIRPNNLSEALDFLDAKGTESKILAGGTDIMVDLRSGTLNTRHLLDVSRLDDMKKIEILDGKLSIGAAVTIAELLKSETIAASAPASVWSSAPPALPRPRRSSAILPLRW